jgi:hypothetical protein
VSPVTYSTDFSDSPFFLGGKGLRHIHTGINSRRAISWDTPGSISDVEIVAALSFSGSASFERFAVIMRGGGTTSNEDGYTWQIREDAGFNLQYYDGGSTSLIASAGAEPLPGARYFMRVRAEGTSLKGKYWLRGQEEPSGWMIEETDSRLASGWVGLWSFMGTGDPKYCDYFAVHSGTGSAPLPGETPGGNDDVTDFSSQTVDSAPSDWTEEWSTSNSTWTVVDDADEIMPLDWVSRWNPASMGIQETANSNATGGRWLRQTEEGAAQEFVQWTEVPDAQDVTITAKIFPRNLFGAGTNFRSGVVARGGGNAGNANGYTWSFGQDGGSTVLRLRKVVNGTFTTIATTSTGVWSVGDWHWVKLQCEGSTIRAKVWEDGNAEPSGWTVEETDLDLTIGGVGIHTNSGAFNSDNIWDSFEVEVSPVGEPAETPARLTQVGLEHLLTTKPLTRLTQIGLEVLYTEPPPIRLTQVGIEYLGHDDLIGWYEGDIRVGHKLFEVPAHATQPEIEVTQVTTEVMLGELPTELRVSQFLVENQLRQIFPEIRVTQILVEAILVPCPPLEWPPEIDLLERTENGFLVVGNQPPADVEVRVQLYSFSDFTTPIFDTGWTQWQEEGWTMPVSERTTCHTVRYGYRDECPNQLWTQESLRLDARFFEPCPDPNAPTIWSDCT